MAAIANSPSFAKKVGVPQSVGKEFNNADKGKTFKRGGDMKAATMKKGGMPMKMKDGKKVPIFMNKGGGMAKGGGIEAKGKTEGKMIKMNKSGKAR